MYIFVIFFPFFLLCGGFHMRSSYFKAIQPNLRLATIMRVCLFMTNIFQCYLFHLFNGTFDYKKKTTDKQVINEKWLCICFLWYMTILHLWLHLYAILSVTCIRMSVFSLYEWGFSHHKLCWNEMYLNFRIMTSSCNVMKLYAHLVICVLKHVRGVLMGSFGYCSLF